MNFIEAIFSHSLILYALLGSFLAAIVSGIVGSYVVVKRIAFLAGSISHSVLGGIGIALWMQKRHGIEWMTPLIGALVAAIISAILIGVIRVKFREREDSIIGALWTVGMATGVLFISATPGFNVELTNFLIGNLLWVTPEDLWILACLNVVALVLIIPLHKKLLALCFDEEQATLQGVPVQPLYLLLLILIAISVVLLTQVVGVLLVLTMLTIPAAIGNLFTRRLSFMMGLAMLLSCFFSFSGMWIAYDLDLPPGATIALITGLAYGILLMLKRPFLKLTQVEGHS